MLLLKIYVTNNHTIYLGLHIRGPNIFGPNFNQIWIFSTDFHKSHNNKYHENLSSGGGGGVGVPHCYMKKLTGRLHEYAKCLKKQNFKMGHVTFRS